MHSDARHFGWKIVFFFPLLPLPRRPCSIQDLPLLISSSGNLPSPARNCFAALRRRSYTLGNRSSCTGVYLPFISIASTCVPTSTYTYITHTMRPRFQYMHHDAHMVLPRIHRDYMLNAMHTRQNREGYIPVPKRVGEDKTGCACSCCAALCGSSRFTGAPRWNDVVWCSQSWTPSANQPLGPSGRFEWPRTMSPGQYPGIGGTRQADLRAPKDSLGIVG